MRTIVMKTFIWTKMKFNTTFLIIKLQIKNKPFPLLQFLNNSLQTYILKFYQ